MTIQAREIKFRAWNIIHNEMTNNFTLLAAINQDQAFVCPENFVYMQFTGLYDKAGVEIFEGDIVACGTLEGSPVGAVEWLQDMTEYKAVNNGLWVEHVTALHAKDMEVIGNIYANPELLEAV